VPTTLMENGGSDVVPTPSVTAILISANEPMSAGEGRPLSRPVAVLKDAHAGRFSIVNVKRSFSASEAEGRKA
jgi:hypothetical protein